MPMLVTLLRLSLAVLLSVHSGSAASAGRKLASDVGGLNSAQGALLRTEKEDEPSAAELASLAADSNAKASDADAAMKKLMASFGQDVNTKDSTKDSADADMDFTKLTGSDSLDAPTTDAAKLPVDAAKLPDDDAELKKMMASFGQTADVNNASQVGGDSDGESQSQLDQEMADLDKKSAKMDEALKELDDDEKKSAKTQQKDTDTLADIKDTDTVADIKDMDGGASLLEVQGEDAPITTSFFTRYTDRLSSHMETRMAKMETHIQMLTRQVQHLQQLLEHKHSGSVTLSSEASLLELDDGKDDDAGNTQLGEINGGKAADDAYTRNSKWLDEELAKIGNKWHAPSDNSLLSQDSKFEKDDAAAWLNSQVKDQKIDAAADSKWLDEEVQKLENKKEQK